jgi:hypothetical protein
MPREVIHKVLDGLIKNAVENTPDEGKIEVAVQKKGEGPLFLIRDYGVGIPKTRRSVSLRVSSPPGTPWLILPRGPLTSMQAGRVRICSG